jgi:putative spermidine/putrescine transport system permease protein
MGGEIAARKVRAMTEAFLTSAEAPTEVPLKRRLKRAERARQI